MQGYPRVEGEEENKGKESAFSSISKSPSLPPLYVPPSARRLLQFHHLGGEGNGPGPAILYAFLAMGAKIARQI